MNSNFTPILLVLLLFFLIVLFHASVLAMPLFINMFVIFYIITRKLFVFFLAFFVGFLLDILLVRNIGVTSIFLVVFMFFVILYERKFEIDTPQFVFFATFLGSVAYLFSFGYSGIFLQALVNGFVGVTFYIGLRVVIQKR